ncbi:MAG: hypothetical protein AAGF59_14630 [Pseudomonadota bacterium]
MIVFVLLVIAGAGLARIYYAPLSAPWIGDRIAGHLQSQLGPDIAVSIAEGSIHWHGGGDVTVGLSDVAIERGPAMAAAIKSLTVDLVLRPFGTDRMSLRDIRVVQPDLTIPWPPPLPRPRSPWPMPVGPFDAANRIIDDFVKENGARLFENMTLVDGRIERVHGPGEAPLPWLRNIAGSASVENAGETLLGVLTGVSARGKTFDASFERSARTSDEQGHAVKIAVKGFDFPFSRRAAADPDGTFGWVPVDIRASGEFAGDYTPHNVLFSADMGPGTVPLGTRDRAYLKNGRLELAFEPEERRFRIAVGRAEIGDSVFEFGGTLTPDSKDPLDPWQLDIEARDAHIDPTDVPGAPLILERVLVVGAILPRERTLQVDRFSVQSPKAPIEGIATWTFLDKGMMFSAASNFGRIHAETLKRIWPSFVSSGARNWALDNLVDGVVDRARIDVSIGPELMDGDPATTGGADHAVDMAFDYSGVTIKSFGEMSPVLNASGSSVIKGRTLDVSVASAALATPDGRPVDVTEGSFRIADLYDRGREGEVSFSVSGENTLVGAIANQAPVRALERLGVEANALSGSVIAKVDAVFPLSKTIPPDAVDWDVDADFTKLSSETPIDGRSIKQADVNVVIDPQMLVMTGVATLDGVRADIQIREPFGDPTASMTGDLTLVLNDKERIARGIDLGDVLKGPVAVGISVKPNGDQQIAVDLTTARVTIPVFGWTKAKGISGNARFLLKDDGDRKVLDDFRLEVGEAFMEGRVVLNSSGQVASAEATRFTIRKGDSATVKSRLVGKNRYEIDFVGDRFDGRGLIKTIKSQQASPEEGSFAEEDFIVTSKVKTLVGFNGETLRDLSSTMVMKRNTIESFEAKARIGETGATEATIRTDTGESVLNVTTSDAGALLRLTDVYDGVEKGDGFLTGRSPLGAEAEDRMTGHVTITGFSLRTTQEFSNRFAETSRNLNVRDDIDLPPITTQQDSRMAFEKFRAAYDLRNGKIDVSEAFVRSPLIGGSLTGAIDLRSELLALSGTMIPVYGLNNLFGQIPVIGKLMGAGRHGGLVGVTFRITGPIGDPKLQINPASALAPGIFRRIFEFR